MGANSHNRTIDESAKPFTRKLTTQEYDLKVMSPREFCKRWGCTKAQREELVARLER